MQVRSSRFGGVLGAVVRSPPAGVPEHTVDSPRGPYLGADRSAFLGAGRSSDHASRRLYGRGARDVLPERYLRTGFSLPHTGWVLDLGASRGLFSVQVVVEVLGNFGDAAALVGRLRQHGFAADLRDNTGTRVCATSSRPDYAYFRRS